MVVSKINPKIEYNESKKIHEEDKGHLSSIYEIELFNKRVAVAIGKIKYEFTLDKIVYYPVYLIKDDVVKSQIGVIEINTKDISNYTDEESSIDFEKFAKDGNALLLYRFVDKDFLHMSKSDPMVFYLESVAAAEPEEEIEFNEPEKSVFDLQYKKGSTPEFVEENDESVFEDIKEWDVPEMLKEETKSDADKLKNNSANLNWVQKFMKNENFRIHKVPGDGDCFFTVVKDAFKQIGKKTTIDKLRGIVAKTATVDMFESYYNIYHGFLSEIEENELKIKKIHENIKKLKARYSSASEKKEKDAILTQIKNHNSDAQTFAKYIATAKRDINEFEFMKDVNNLVEFKQKVMDSKYWADDAAINILENNLNVKVIILDEQNFKSKDEDNVLKCASGAKEEIPNPTPEYYIMAAYVGGNHYELISYKDKKILKFSEIPYYIKTLIVNKCIEKNAGSFPYITDFKHFQQKFGIDPTKSMYSESDVVVSELFEPDTQFMFYIKSADANPGKGSGEKINAGDLSKYKELQLITDWRRKLDDEFESPFTFGGKRWQTVEHYYQASKYKKGFPDFYNSFSLDDANSEIANDVKKAKAAGGKTGVFEKQELRDKKKIKMDPDFFDSGRNVTERANAVMAKFEESAELKKILLNTKKAKLLHFRRGSEPDIDTVLMDVRSKMKPAM